MCIIINVEITVSTSLMVRSVSQIIGTLHKEITVIINIRINKSTLSKLYQSKFRNYKYVYVCKRINTLYVILIF